ncbi:MAG: hypothetical protein FJ125_01775 [Deltaproteobacteria bacterium]|nr:hypothetical protein [Deltaproteobacteria bacterium]
MEDWEQKLRELERSIDGAPAPASRGLVQGKGQGRGKGRGKELIGSEGGGEEAPEAVDSTRILRWTVIGAGAGAGLVLAYFVLRVIVPYLVVLLLLGGVGYGGYRYMRFRLGKKEDGT